MIMRLFVLEQACFDVEFLTRCLYEDYGKTELPEMRQDYYLECHVKFSDSLPEPDNGETLAQSYHRRSPDNLEDITEDGFSRNVKPIGLRNTDTSI